jgi:hypothetical protein
MVWAVVRVSRKNARAGERWFSPVENALSRLAARPRLAVFSAGLLALAARALFAPLIPIRAPQVTDEFGYLLGADTFASGRLANPPHPMWRHMETIHVMGAPTYSSIYMPAQALALAAGIRLVGHPWAGVYLSVGLMCMAICWMLQGWLPPRWALLGALLAVLRLGIFGYWMNSYWGGAPAAAGGALVLGALPRLRWRMRVGDALLMGLGAAILAASRPYEGGVLCLVAGGYVLVWLFGKRGPPLWNSVTQFLLPVTLMLGLTAAGLGYYFYRVTGDPLRLPESIQSNGNPAGAPFFIWNSIRPARDFHYKALHNYYAVWEVNEVAVDLQTFFGQIWGAAKKVIASWVFFLGPALTVPLIFLPQIVKRDRKMRPLIIIGAAVSFAMLLDAWFYAHYAAPIAGLLFALVAQGLRRLRVWRRRSREGLLLARAVPAICVAVIAVRIVAQPVGLLSPPAWPMTWYHTTVGNTARATVLARLSKMEGGQLAIVRYRSDHNAVMNEWVYNSADIDQAKVVWARDINPGENRELLEYFHDRRVWLVDADRTPPVFVPYPRQ